MHADGLKPKSKREEAAGVAEALLKEEQFALFEKRADKQQVGFATFHEKANGRFFAASTPVEMIREPSRKRRDKEIQEQTGLADTSLKFTKLAEVIGDIADVGKPVDVEGLKAGFLAVKAIEAYAAGVAASEKRFTNPDSAAEVAAALKAENPANPATGELHQGEASQNYYMHKHYADGMGQIAGKLEHMMNVLAITVPKGGDFGPGKNGGG